MYTLTLQAYTSGEWLDAMTLIFVEPEKGFDGACRFGYKSDYVINNVEDLESPFAKSVSAKLPLDWDSVSLKKAPAFLLDLVMIGNPQALFEGLREDANRLMALPDILSASGLPEVTMNHPAIALRNLEQRLKNWGLK